MIYLTPEQILFLHARLIGNEQPSEPAGAIGDPHIVLYTRLPSLHSNWSDVPPAPRWNSQPANSSSKRPTALSNLAAVS